MKNSARNQDQNGYIEIRDNPITKVGVFKYLGSSIKTSEDDGIDPNEIYDVYRSAEELADPACIESFKLIPWIDDHVMLGNPSITPGVTAPEEKGVEGVVGEQVYFDAVDGYLKANLKIFSTRLEDIINKGKKELSIGYRAMYKLQEGVYNGQKYSVIQHTLRGNHLARVDEGRAGKDVAVLDHFKITFDSTMGVIQVDPEKKEIVVKDEVTLESLMQEVKNLAAAVAAMVKEKSEDECDPATKVADEDEPVKKVEDEDEPAKKVKDEDEPAKKVKDAEEKVTAAMDAKIKASVHKYLKEHAAKFVIKETSKRDEMAEQLSKLVGAFDHKEKTLQEVAKYGVEKLKLTCDSGEEIATLKGFLSAQSFDKKVLSEQKATVDSKDQKPTSIQKLFRGEQ